MYKPDISVYAADGKLQLIVEVKNIGHSSRAWAAQFIRNLLVHGMLTAAPFVMLVCSDRMYLWKDVSLDKLSPSIRDPDYEDETAVYLKPFLPRAERLASGMAFEMAVRSWLDQLMSSEPLSQQLKRNSTPFLCESGLFDAIWHGSATAEATV